MKQLIPVLGNSQKLDGGAMFGNVPKTLWSRWLECDDRNRIHIACRGLLIIDKKLGKTILLETGVGNFFDPKLKDRYGVEESEHVLLHSLAEAGKSHEDIDYVILSHLHFDHAGGLLSPWQANKASELLFPNARFIVGQQAWLRAKNPHSRDRASFIPELITLLEQSGRLEIIDGDRCSLLNADYRFHYSDGHTPGMMHTEIQTEEGPVIFAADLIPGKPWVHLPVTMGYDRFAEKVIDEKKQMLDYLIANNGRLFFTHDNETAFARVGKDEHGRYVVTA